MTDIKLRYASEIDREQIFKWRNAPETRQFSFNSELIPWETHVKWFDETLKRKDRILLIAEENHLPVGVLRYDLVSQDLVVVDIYLLPGLQGKGLGTRLLIAAVDWAKINIAYKKIRAEIISENIASIKAFTKAGFQEKFRVFEITT